MLFRCSRQWRILFPAKRQILPEIFRLCPFLKIYQLFYLKKAGFEMLSHGDLLALLGIGGTDRSWELFQSLEPVMDPEAFQYFLGHPEFFEKEC